MINQMPWIYWNFVLSEVSVLRITDKGYMLRQNTGKGTKEAQLDIVQVRELVHAEDEIAHGTKVSHVRCLAAGIRLEEES